MQLHYPNYLYPIEYFKGYFYYSKSHLKYYYQLFKLKTVCESWGFQ